MEGRANCGIQYSMCRTKWSRCCRPAAGGRGSGAFLLGGWRLGTQGSPIPVHMAARSIPEDLVPLLLKALPWLPSTHRATGTNPSFPFGQNPAPSPSPQIQPFKDLFFQEAFPNMFESSLRSWTQFSLLFPLLTSGTFCLRPIMYFSPDFISLGARDLPLSLAQLQPETRPNSLHSCLKKKKIFYYHANTHCRENLGNTEKYRKAQAENYTTYLYAHR